MGRGRPHIELGDSKLTMKMCSLSITLGTFILLLQFTGIQAGHGIPLEKFKIGITKVKLLPWVKPNLSIHVKEEWIGKVGVVIDNGRMAKMRGAYSDWVYIKWPQGDKWHFGTDQVQIVP